MGMTGLQIYKLLPKTNCKKCGYGACLAFAMALSSGKTKAEQCPDMSEQLKLQISEASLTPVREVVFGSGEALIKVGAEKVIYRHEETFYNKPCLAVSIEDSNIDNFTVQSRSIADFKMERAGVTFSVDAVAIRHSGGDFAAAARLSPRNKALILIADEPEIIGEALKASPDRKPLIICRGASCDNIIDWSINYECAVALFASSFEELHSEADKLECKNVKNIFFSLHSTLKERLIASSASRRSAVYFRQRTYPFVYMLNDIIDEDVRLISACAALMRYAGCIVLPFSEPASLLPLLTLSSNVYSDPRRPAQVEPGIYKINEPDNTSPVFITTNFSLTHFLVSSEIEASRKPVWLLIADTGGTSLLTAWAADKFNAEIIDKTLRETGIGDKVSHRTLVICSHVASLKKSVEEKTDWKVIIGTGDSSGISSWLKNFNMELLR